MPRAITLSLLLLYSVWLFPQSNKIQDAIQNYQYGEALQLLEAEPSTRENLLLKATCYQKLYRYADALDIYKQLQQEYPDDVSLYISMAECASQAGDLPLSIQSWMVADSLSPDNRFIQTQKIMAFHRNGRWGETIEHARAVLATDSIPLLLRLVGDAFQFNNNRDSAVWYYSKAVEINPSDYLAVNKLGRIYLEAKFYEPVIELTEIYLDSINAERQLIGQLNGMAHYSAGNYKEATQRLKKNVELGDSSYTTCYYLGMSLYASMLYFESVPWFEKAYEQSINREIGLLYYYGTALSRTFDRNKGIEVLKEGVQKIEEINGMLFDFDCSFADAYQRSNNFAKAIDYYQSAYKQKPESYSLLYNIGYCYELMEDYKNAISYYERFLKTIPLVVITAEAPASKEVDEDNSVLNGEPGQDEILYRAVSQRIERLQKELFFQSKGNKSD